MRRIEHTEWIDQRGLDDARREIGRQKSAGLSKKNAASAEFLLRYLDAVDKAYGDPNENYLRPMRVPYARLYNYGRAYSKAPKGPNWSENQPSSVSVQGMSAALRPFLLNTVCHDIDIENCHPTLIEQLAKWWHMWPEHGGIAKPIDTTQLHSLVTDRAAFFEQIATFHALPPEEHRPGHRKKLCKQLILRLMYGGSYEAWLREHRLPLGKRVPRVVALQQEIATIRDALLNSNRFGTFVQAERARLANKGKRDEEADRSIFAKIAQHLEHTVLMAMRNYLIWRGWEVHSLVFDGLTVGHQEGRSFDLREMEWYVERETQFQVKITEKALFGAEAVLELSSVDVAMANDAV